MTQIFTFNRFRGGVLSLVHETARKSSRVGTELLLALLLMGTAVSALGADKLVVKVTGGASDAASGYYVAYTINGNIYRSDEVGQRINEIAYANMSDADKRKTVEFFTFYQDRKEQFGEEVATTMGKDYNAKWIEAAEILKSRLTEKDFPGLTERFSDSQKYFNENFLPKTCTVEELKEFPETKKLYEAETEFFSWACAAYAAMRQAEYLRTQVAMQSVAGDLISLICDKALVPNITPSGALSGAASIGQKLFSEAIEYADKASGYCDNAVAMLTGQRVTASMATEVMTAMAGTIDCQYQIIKRSLEACHDMQNQIDAIYPGLKEAADKADADWLTAEENAEKAYFGQSLAGDAAAGSVTTYEQLTSRVAAFQTSCENAVQTDLATRPVDTYNPPSIYLTFVNGNLGPDCTDAEVNELKAAVKQGQEQRKTDAENAVAWNKAAGEMLKTARTTYHAIASDAAASGYDFNQELENIYAALEAGFTENRSGLGVIGSVVYNDWWSADENAKLENFLAARKAYLENVVPSIAEQYQEGVKQYEDAVAEYEEAWQELTDVLAAVPSYVKSQEMCTSGLVVTEKSELAQKFLADGATGTLNDALSVRETLGASGAAYRKASYRVRMAQAKITAYAGALKNGGHYFRQYNRYGGGTSTLAKKFKDFSEVSKSYSEHVLSDEMSSYPRALLALERDFNTYTYAHCQMLDQLGDFVANRELYSTNVLEKTQDPYVRKAYAARRLSATPKRGYYTTPASIVMPGYYVGYGKTTYEIALCEADDRNRGTCSYSYYIDGYAERVGKIVSDPYDTVIKPLLDEIDAERANHGGESYLPDDPDDPDDPADPDDAESTPTLFEEVVGGGISEKGATYNGFLGDDTLGGTFTLVVKKPRKGATTAVATMTLVNPSTGRKVKVSGNVDITTGVCSGDLAGLTLGATGLTGTYNGQVAQGTVDATKAKNADALAVMNAYKGHASALVFVDPSGDSGLFTITFATKGKAKVKGTIASNKVTGTAQMSVGDRCALPFVYARRNVTVSFVLWFDKSTQKLIGVSGLADGASLTAAGEATTPASGAYVFTMDQDDVLALVPTAIAETPYSIDCSFDGRKFNAGKLASVKYDRKSGAVVVNTQRGGNVSGLMLKYATGALTGSFTVYGLSGTKLTKNKFTVSGVVVDGVGYVSGSNRKLGSIVGTLSGK